VTALGDLDRDRIRELHDAELAWFRAERPRTLELLARAAAHMPNGTPMTWMASDNDLPVYVDRGDGASFTDVDGHHYVDFNASDMAMVIDAMDMLYARSLDAFAIVSSDADFTPLVMRILTEGLKVYGFGEQKTPAPFVNACSQFTFVEGLVQPSATPDEPVLKASDAKKLRGDTRLVLMLRNAVDAASGDDGWAHLGQVRNQIGNQASFDSRNYGYRKFSDLIEATGLFEVKRQNQIMLIRDKRKT